MCSYCIYRIKDHRGGAADGPLTRWRGP